jgi:capsular polysaccharide biosynthesis protein
VTQHSRGPQTATNMVSGNMVSGNMVSANMVSGPMTSRDVAREDAAANSLGPVLRHWWWLVVLLVALSALVGYLGASRVQPTYESRVRVLVGPVEADLDTIRASSGLVQTYAGLVTADAITEAASARLGVEDIGDAVTSFGATANDVTRVLTVRVAAADPETAANTANALAAELALITLTSDLDTGEVRILEAADPGSATTDSQTTLLTGLAAMVGLVAAIALALVFDRRSDRLRSLDEVERVAGLPVLGVVRCRSAAGDASSRDVSELAGPEGAELRFVVSQMMHLVSPGRGGGTISVVPVGESSITSDFVRELALVVASTGRSVLVITASRSLTPPAGDDVLALSRFLVAPHVDRHLPRVPDGKMVTVPADVSGPMLTAPESIPTALTTLAEAAAITIFDLGGLEESVVGFSVALAADAVVVVARDGSIRRRELARTVESVRGARAHPAGVVVVGESSKRRDRSGEAMASMAPTDSVEAVAEASA